MKPKFLTLALPLLLASCTLAARESHSPTAIPTHVVPEPSSWVLGLSGVGLIGLYVVLTRRRKV